MSLAVVLSMLLSLFPSNLASASGPEGYQVEVISSGAVNEDEGNGVIVNSAGSDESDGSGDGDATDVDVVGDPDTDTASDPALEGEAGGSGEEAGDAEDAVDPSADEEEADGIIEETDEADLDADEADVDETADPTDGDDEDADAAIDEDADLESDDEDVAGEAVEGEDEEDADGALLEGLDDDELLLLGAGGGIEGTFTVTFIVEGNLYALQYINEGEPVIFPEKPAIPSGYVSFEGWFTEGTPIDGDPFDFNTIIDGDLTLEARFSTKYLVQFMDGFEEVYLSKRVDVGDVLYELTDDEMEDLGIPEGKYFNFWSLDKATPYSFGNTPVNSDLALYPVFTNFVYVYFVSYGTEVPYEILKSGEQATPPSVEPTRKNYNFNWWSLTSGGGAGAEYDWNLPVTEDLMLYGSWSGVPNSVTYKVVWWLETDNFSGTPTPGNTDHYIFADEDIRIGTPGEYVSVNTLPPYSGDRMSTDPIRYAEFQYCAPTFVSGANNTTVNVYLTRKEYEITFDLTNNGSVTGRWLRFNNSNTTYYDDEYKLNIKYEQNITDLWPSTETATFGPSGFTLYAWSAVVGCGIYGEGTNFVTRRNVVSAELMPMDPTVAGYKLNGITGNLGNYYVRYWFEAYTNQTGVSRQFTAPGGVEKIYILDRQYDQSQMNNISPKIILGTVSVGRNYSDSETGDGYPESSHEYLNFYYDRNINNLYYDMGGADPIDPVYDIKYGTSLAPYKPADPVWEGYMFKGWYKDANRYSEFDFNDAVMTPNTHYTVFAKWESTDFTVTFYDDDELLGTQGVAEGEPVDLSNLFFNGRLYDSNLHDPVKGYFNGWKYLPQYATVMSAYPPDLLVYSDLDLYVNWRIDGFTVTYTTMGAAPGSVAPIDPETYTIGTYARVLEGPAIIPPPGTGMIFIGWLMSGIDRIYYPHSFLPITGDMVLDPVFSGMSDLVSLTYHENYGDNPISVSMWVKKYTDVTLVGETIFPNPRPGYTLLGWQDTPGDPPRTSSGEVIVQYPVPYPGLYPIGGDPVTLYAVWYSDIHRVNEYYVNDRNRSVSVSASTYTMMDGGTGYRYEKPPKDVAEWVAVGYNVEGVGDWYVQRQTGTPVPSFTVIIDPVRSDLELSFLYRADKNKNKIPDEEEEYTITEYFWDLVKGLAINVAPPLTNPRIITINEASGFDYLSQAPDIPGYTADRYLVDSEYPYMGTSYNFTDIVSDHTIDFHYAVNMYTIYYDLSAIPGPVTNPNTKTGYTVQDPDFIILGASAEGYKFLYWEDQDGARFYDGDVAIPTGSYGDKTFKAIFSDIGDLNLKFDFNGGASDSGATSYSVGVPAYSHQVLSAREPSYPIYNPGHEFLGWSTVRDDPATKVEEVDIDDEDFTVYALWTSGPLIYVDLIFDGNGDLANTKVTESVLKYDTVSLNDLGPKNLMKVGYDFDGWSTERDNAATKEDQYRVLDDTTVYALYIGGGDLKVSLTFDGNGDIENTSVTISVPKHEEVSLNDLGPKNLMKVGYDFDGWSTARDNAATKTDLYRVSDNATVYALYTGGGDLKVNLTFDGNGDIENTSVTVSVAKHDTVSLNNLGPKNLMKIGCDFEGWSTEKDNPATQEDQYRVSADTTVYALYSGDGKLEVDLTFDGNGDTAATMQVVKILKHSMVDLDATGPKNLVKPGYEFDGWTETRNAVATKATNIRVSDNKTVYAYWVSMERSDTPNIDPINAGAKIVTGQGIAGSIIDVTWPNGDETQVTVNTKGLWAADVPTGLNLVVNDIVEAVQTENGKLPSLPAQETVGGGDKPGNGISDTPDIFVIHAGDRQIFGRGTAGSLIEIILPDGVTKLTSIIVGTDDLWTANVPFGLYLAVGDVIFAQQTTGTKDPSEWAQRTVVGDTEVVQSDTPNINPIKVGDDVVTGEGVPGAKILVTWPGGAETDNITVGYDGTWSVDVPASVTLNLNDVVTAVQTETGKLPSEPAQETVGGGENPGNGQSDTPDIYTIYAGDDKVTGAGTAGSTITVIFPGNITVETTVDANDGWSVDVPAGMNLVAGDEVFAVQKTLDKDLSDIAQRTVIDRPGGLVSDTPNINPINEDDLVLTGEGIPGATITITWPDGVTTSEAIVDPDGNWSAAVPDNVVLVEEDVITAIQIEPGKEPSEKAQVTVGGGEKTGNGKSDTPNIDVIIAGATRVTGNGVPGSEITVRFKNGTTRTDIVGDNHLWSVNVPAGVTLEIGDMVFATQKTGDKDISDEAQRTVVGEAPPVRSDTPNIDPIKDTDKTVTGQGIPGAEIEVTWPDGVTKSKTTVSQDGNWAVAVPATVTLQEGDIVTAVQTEPGKPESAPAQETVNGDTTTGPRNNGKSDTPDINVIYVGDEVVTGRGTPGSRVGVKFKNGQIIWTIVNPDTTWSVDVPSGISMLKGDEVYGIQRTQGKKPSDWAQRTVIAEGEDIDPNKPRSDTPNINYIKDTDTIVTGEGVPGSAISVKWKTGLTTPATVGANGRWAVRVPNSVTLVEGDIVEATQTEVGKPESIPAHETVNGDTTTGPGNDGESDTPDIDNIYEGDTIVSGMGTPGSEITVRFKGNRTVKTTVDPDGKWSVDVPAGVTLEEGDIVEAMQFTPGKDPSKWAQRTVLGAYPDRNISDTPNINPIKAGATIVTGEGVPGSEIKVIWPNKTESFTTVDASGNWSVNVPSNITLVEGDIVEAIQTETGKAPSDPARETVGGGDTPNIDMKSDTPDIDEIYEGDRTVGGYGTPGSTILVLFENGDKVETLVGADTRWTVDVPVGLNLLAGDKVMALQSTPGKTPSDWALRTVLGGTKQLVSDTPNIYPITEGDTEVRGQGRPGALIQVTWPDGVSYNDFTVNARGRWYAVVPDDIELIEGDIVTAVQTEYGKHPSLPAQETVGGGDIINGEKSDTPDIDDIYAGDIKVTGRGTAGSRIYVKFPGGEIVETTVGLDDTWSVDVPQGLTLKVGDEIFAQQKTGQKELSDWAQRTVLGGSGKLISDTPNVNPLNEDDPAVTGQGIPGADIEVTWPDGTTSTGTVDEDGNWSVSVPDDVDLKEDDIVTVVQTEPGKDPSTPAQVTVGGGEREGNGKSDTPNIDVIIAGDKIVSGNGVPGSVVTVKFENNSTVSATVQDNRLWSVNVPAGVTLAVGDVVFAIQVTGDKEPSDEAQRTVIAEAPPLRSDTPNIDEIIETDTTVTGQGIPNAEITVTWPGGRQDKVTVGMGGNWAVDVPSNVTLKVGDIVIAVQKEPGKLVSAPAQETVGGGDVVNGEKSDTPDIDVIYENAEVVTGRGTPGSKVAVMFRNGVTVWVTVGANTIWSADVPAGLDMLEGDPVYAQQYTSGKDPSDRALRTVIKKGGDIDPKILRSDTPNINPIKDTDKVVTGEGVPGSVITVTWKNGAKTNTVVDARGRWVVNVPASVTLIEGDIVTAVQLEKDKPVSEEAHETVNGDTKTGPGNDGYSDTPDIDNIYEGDTSVTGRGTPGSEITVRFPDGRTTKVKVGSNGRWSVDIPDDMTLKEGDIIEAMQSTPGKLPSKWAQRTVIKKTPAFNQSDTPNIHPIDEGDRLVSGEGTPGAEIEVFWPDGTSDKTTVDEDGNWIIDVPKDLDLVEGDIVTVIQTEPGKEPSVPAQETVGGGEKPGNGKSDTPDIDVIVAGDRVIKGNGTPGSEIVVLFPNGDYVHTIVGNDTRWTVNVPTGLNLVAGDEIFAVQTTGAKDPSDWAQKTVVAFWIIRSDTPNIDSIMEGDRVVSGQGVPGAEIIITWPNGATSRVWVGADRNWIAAVPQSINLVVNEVVTAVQKEADKEYSRPAQETVGGGEKPGNGKSDTPDIDVIRAGDKVVTGRGTPGSTIVVVFPDKRTRTTTVDQYGKWSVDVPGDLVAGDEVIAAQKTGDKDPSDWAKQTVIGDGLPNISDTPNVNPINEGDRRVTGNGKPGSRIIVTWPGGSKTETTVGSDGNWAIDVPGAVNLKVNDVVTVVQIEPGKDPSVPAHVTVGGGDKPGDGKSDTPNVDTIREGDTVISGDGTAGSTIRVRLPDGKTVSATVGANNRWSVNVPAGTALVKGDIVYVAQVTPGKLPSDWVQKTVEAALGGKSSQPKVNPITEGDRSISGEGTPGAEIVVTWPGGSQSRTTVGSDGKWTISVPANVQLQAGNTVRVVQNEIGKLPSDPVIVTVASRGTTPGRPGNQGTGNYGLPTVVTQVPDETPPLAIPNGFKYDHIQYIKGYPWGTVAPDSAITRAETAEIIYRLLEASDYAAPLTSPFPDVGSNEWYTQSISYLASIGIVIGYLDGTFRPDNSITRAEFAKMIAGFDHLEQVDYNAFPDVEGHWAVGYINSAATKGWVAGYPDGTFRPENNITRAEVITIINRMLIRKIEAADIPDWAPSYSDLDESHWAYTDIIEASIGHKYERKSPTNDYEIWIERLR